MADSDDELPDLSDGISDDEAEGLEIDVDDDMPVLFPAIPADEEEMEDDVEYEMPGLSPQNTPPPSPPQPQQPQQPPPQQPQQPPPQQPQQPPQQNPPILYYGNDGTVWTTALPNRHVRVPAENLVPIARGQPIQIPVGASFLEIFLRYMSDNILDSIILHSNNYAESVVAERNREAAELAAQLLAQGVNPPPPPNHVWVPITKTELLGFIGILLWAGYDRSKKYPIELLWSKDKTFSRPIPTATLSRNRFKVIMRVLRFDDVAARRQLVTQVGRENVRKGAPVNEFLENFNLNIIHLFQPGPLLTVDEMLVKFRGRAPFRVYMKTKPGRYGLKVWMIVDTQTSYVCGFQLYEGKPPGGQVERNLGQRVVLDLVRPFINSGRGVTTDNFFTSISLARELHDVRLTLLGTIRKTRREVPRPLTVKRNFQEFQTVFVFNNDGNCNATLCSYKPRARKDVVLLLSTEHHDDHVPAIDNPERKPAMILDYNSRKGGVDSADQLIAEYSCQRPVHRWPMKIFFAVLDVAALNSYKVFLQQNPEFGLSRNPRIPNQPKPIKCRRLRAYRDLVLDLIWPQIEQRYLAAPNLHRYVIDAMNNIAVTLNRNLPVRAIVAGPPPAVVIQVPQQGNPPRRRQVVGRCHVCVGNVRDRTNSKTRCSLCNQFACAQHKHDRFYCYACVVAHGGNIQQHFVNP